ncbi:MAG TPA: apolipoprotein N-acyltransferase [Burkholderiaceae bacterium]|nr:apolipoprotein N-acyltransferase [Burkholderiaceae bacterium]
MTAPAVVVPLCSGRSATLLALLAGALHALALAPWPSGGLQLLAQALLLALLPWRSPRRAAWLGGCFGFTWLLGSVHWLFVSMHRYGQLPAWMAATALVALVAFMALYVAAAAALWSAAAPHGRLAAAGFWALVWLALELARAQWFTGFPWGAAGYAHVDSPLVVLAPWVGVHGVAAAAAGLAALLGLAARGLTGRRGWLPVLAPLLLQAWPAGWVGPDLTEPGRTLSVTLLQGNVPQDEKFDAARLPAVLDWHVQQLEAAQTDLVVAPETAIPLLPEQLPVGLWERLQQHFHRGSTHALFGMPLGSYETGYTNSVVGLGPQSVAGAAYRYDKHHLVPFGEFIPWGFRWFVDLMRIPLGDFNRGALPAASYRLGDERLAPNICYEDLFGEELAARWIDPAQAPTVLVNVSNIGWFGETVAVSQHLQISRLRALELQRPMLRATNTGATVIIDHRGRVTHRVPPHQRAVLVGSVQGRQGSTPYALWAGRLGLWPLWGLALGGMLLLARARVREAHPHT